MTQLQWNTHRKSYVACQNGATINCCTLSDLEGHSNYFKAFYYKNVAYISKEECTNMK